MVVVRAPREGKVSLPTRWKNTLNHPGGGKTLKCCLEVDYVARNESDILIRNTNLHLFFLVFMGQIKRRTTKKSIKSVSRNKSGLFQSR